MNTSERLQRCISTCRACADMCFEMVRQLGFAKTPTETRHLTLMADCADICHLAVNFMQRQSEFHEALCQLCADICEACADACAASEDTHMRECADLCRTCASQCREMSTENA